MLKEYICQAINFIPLVIYLLNSIKFKIKDNLKNF